MEGEGNLLSLGYTLLCSMFLSHYVTGVPLYGCYEDANCLMFTLDQHCSQ